MTTPTYASAATLRARAFGVSMDCPARCLMCEAHEVREEQQRAAIADLHYAHDVDQDAVEEARIVAEEWRIKAHNAGNWKAVLAFLLVLTWIGILVNCGGLG